MQRAIAVEASLLTSAQPISRIPTADAGRREGACGWDAGKDRDGRGVDQTQNAAKDDCTERYAAARGLLRRAKDRPPEEPPENGTREKDPRGETSRTESGRGIAHAGGPQGSRPKARDRN
jgi:hypothetical protein